MAEQKKQPSPLKLTVEAAKHLRVKPGWLEKRRCSGDDGPPFIRIGARKVAYLVEDLDAWLAARPRRTNTSDQARRAR